MPPPFSRAWGFGDIPGLEQEIDRLYWMLGEMWSKRKSASEIGERREGRNKAVNDVISGELTAKSLRIGRTKNSIPIEKIETFVIDHIGQVIGANSSATLSITDSDFPQLVEIRRGTLWNVYLDPGHSDLITTSRIGHASSGDNNGTLKVSLFNTTAGAITLSAGKAYFTLVTPRSF